MAEDARETQTGRRPGVAVLLSGLFPGLGHWYVGRGRAAALMAIPTVMFVIAFGWMLSLGRVRLLELAVQPRVLWAILIVDLSFLVWRLVVGGDAFRIANGGVGWPGWGTAIVTAVVVVVVAAPHVIVASYTASTIDLLESVFVADGAPATSTTSTTTTVVLAGYAQEPVIAPFPEADRIPDTIVDPAIRARAERAAIRSERNAIFQESIGDPLAVAIWPDIVGVSDVEDVSSLLPEAEVADLERVTILLAGGDGGPGRGGSRTDSIMVATLDLVNGRAALFSIPRNLAQFPLPDHLVEAYVEFEQRLAPYVPKSQWVDEDGDGDRDPPPFVPCRCFPDQINAMYPWSRTWTETYPDEPEPGMAALRDALELMLGIEIDFYAMVDMSGFVRLVDALGGVRTYVLGHVVTEVSPAYEGGEWISVDLSAGWHKLKGEEALAYVRERRSVGDYTRTKRQRCLLKAVAASADPLTIATRYNAIVGAVKSAVKTDIPLSLVPTLVGHAAQLDSSDIVTIGFVPPDYAPEVDHKNHPIPDLARIQAMVQLAMSADGDAAFETGHDSECRL